LETRESNNLGTTAQLGHPPPHPVSQEQSFPTRTQQPQPPAPSGICGARLNTIKPYPPPPVLQEQRIEAAAPSALILYIYM